MTFARKWKRSKKVPEMLKARRALFKAVKTYNIAKTARAYRDSLK